MAEEQEIRFEYIKSNSYRDIHVDGAFGGITTKGYVFMSIFSERNPIPTAITHRLKEDGTLGKELSREGRKCVLRTVESVLFMDIDTAESVAQWILQKTKALKEVREQFKNQSQDNNGGAQ